MILWNDTVYLLQCAPCSQGLPSPERYTKLHQVFYHFWLLDAAKTGTWQTQALAADVYTGIRVRQFRTQHPELRVPLLSQVAVGESNELSYTRRTMVQARLRRWSDVPSERPCVVCGSVAKLCCSACRLYSYCGALCQRKDWSQHKDVCKVACVFLSS